jgi:2-methylcitrate dehydratase PrpD
MFSKNRVSPDLFQSQLLSEEQIISIIDKIELFPDENYTYSFPGKLGSRVEVKLKNGETLEAEVLTAPWEFGYHPDISDLKQKFNLQTNRSKHIKWDWFFDF